MTLLATFSELSAQAVRDAIERAHDPQLVFERDVFIPEADILMCRFHGKRFHVRVDLDYGAELEAIDPLSPEEAGDIMRLIVSRAGPDAPSA